MIVRVATRQTRDCTPDSARTREIAPAFGTAIEKTLPANFSRQWKAMTAFFVADLKVAASLPPLDAMRQNPAPAGARLREKMRQLMPEGAIDFGGMMDKLWV
jgi:hypothetical protein